MYYLIIPKGTREGLPKKVELSYEVVEIDMDELILPQLIQIEARPDRVSVFTPDWWENPDKEKFIQTVSHGWQSISISRNTSKTFSELWVTNMFENYLKFLHSEPITEAPRNHDRAIIVGIGPSVAQHTLYKPVGCDVIACWHAAPIINEWKIDYLAHCDPKRDVDFDDFGLQLSTHFIAPPQVTPEFLDLMGFTNRVYGYYGRDFIFNHLFGYEHEMLNGTVASLMLNAAGYMGYEEVALLGIDHAWTDDKDAHETKEGDIEVVNSHGVTVKTSPVFQTAANGLGKIVRENPQMKVYQTTKAALDIKGVAYKPLGDFINGRHIADGITESLTESRA